MVPEDFRVQEEIDLAITGQGQYRIYTMQNRSWNTLDAINHLAKASRISPSSVGYAGRKDRHALTRQYISVPGHMELISNTPGVELEQVGFADDFVSTRVLRGNRFELTVRALSPRDVASFKRNILFVSETGFPNYYDDQRFGSVTGDGFFAERLVRGHFKGALKMHLTAPKPGDDFEERERKRSMAQNWGNWDKVLGLCVNKHESGIIAELQEGGRKKNLLAAVNKIDSPVMAMYLSCYQSFLWNQSHLALMKNVKGSVCRCKGRVGDYLFYNAAEDTADLSGLCIPTVARKLLPTGPEVIEAINRVLAERGVSQNVFSLRGVKNGYFKSFQRKAFVVPKEFAIGEIKNDDRYPKFKKIELSFSLPAGSYATMAVKALFCAEQGDLTNTEDGTKMH